MKTELKNTFMRAIVAISLITMIGSGIPIANAATLNENANDESKNFINIETNENKCWNQKAYIESIIDEDGFYSGSFIMEADFVDELESLTAVLSFYNFDNELNDELTNDLETYFAGPNNLTITVNEKTAENFTIDNATILTYPDDYSYSWEVKDWKLGATRVNNLMLEVNDYNTQTWNQNIVLTETGIEKIKEDPLEDGSWNLVITNNFNNFPVLYENLENWEQYLNALFTLNDGECSDILLEEIDTVLPIVPVLPTIPPVKETEEELITKIPTNENVLTSNAANNDENFVEGAVRTTGDTTPNPNSLINVVPFAPTLKPAEKCGQEPVVDVQKVEGIKYSGNRDGDKLIVTATAMDGYVIADNVQTEWEFDMSVEKCNTEPEKPIETNSNNSNITDNNTNDNNSEKTQVKETAALNTTGGSDSLVLIMASGLLLAGIGILTTLKRKKITK